ncbi:DUF2079 domain-containing protein [Spirillospora sp. CA-255316]
MEREAEAMAGPVDVAEPEDPAEARPRGRSGPGPEVGRERADGRRLGSLERWAPGVLAALFFCLYTAYALARHRNLQTAGFDLGIFDQAVRAYARFEAPIVPLKGPGFNLLGDHFHPVLALLAPLYWVWPHPGTLLVAQAALIAVSVVPVGRFAIRRLGLRAGLVIATMYGLSWGVQGAIGFDFHEVAFAVPMLAFAMVALAERRWTAAAVWTLPLVFVKEDMGLTVAAVGAYLWWRHRRRTGALLVVAGAGTTLLAVKVVVPHFNPHGFSYSAFMGDGAGPVMALLGLPGALADQPGRTIPIAMIVAITFGAVLRSPLTLLAVPALLPRVLSDNPLHWAIGGVHYNAPLMPVVFVATISVLPAFAASRRRVTRGYGRAVIPVTVVFTLLPPVVIPGAMLSPEAYRTDAHAAAARRLLERIPDGADVAASNMLAAQLVDRADVVLFPPRRGERVDWVAVDTRWLAWDAGKHRTAEEMERVVEREKRADMGLDSPSSRQQIAAMRTLAAQGFVQVGSSDGALLFHRRAARR